MPTTDMWVPTHHYDGIPVKMVRSNYIQQNGKVIKPGGFQRDKLVPAARTIDITPSVLSLVMRAMDPNPGRGIMPGYATDVRGNLATRLNETEVRLSVKHRDGSNAHYLITLPETFTIDAIVLEDPK